MGVMVMMDVVDGCHGWLWSMDVMDVVDRCDGCDGCGR